MIKTETKNENLFFKFTSELGLTNVYDNFIVSVPSGPKFIRLNEFNEVEVYEKCNENLLKVVNVDPNYDDVFSLFFKITKGI